MLFIGIGEGLLLLSLGLGYIVLYLAQKQTHTLKFLGYCIALIIIIFSLSLLSKNLILSLTYNIKRINGLCEQQVSIPPFPEKATPKN
ncbi:MAG: hypothetical protein WC335_02400 [Candidatus Omnitrophota bacterium]|jgi:hypothetical protein